MNRQEYMKSYRQRPEVKAREAERKRKYRQRPEMKAREAERERKYYQRPEVKARKAEYSQRPEVKAAHRSSQRARWRAERTLKLTKSLYELKQLITSN